MEDINRIRKISILIFIIPVVVLNLCLFINIYGHLFQGTIFQVDAGGRYNFTFPYIDGGVSISRTVRTYPTYLLFKPGMIIAAILLIKYWIANNRLFKTINNETNKNKYFLFFGVGSAVFLISHSIFLGINFEPVFFFQRYEVDLYKFFRKFVLLGFIISEIIAQALLVINIIKIKVKIETFFNKKILTLKIILVSVLILVAILSLPILSSPGYTHLKHALEWNYFMGVVLFYLLTFLFWKKTALPVHAP